MDVLKNQINYQSVNLEIIKTYLHILKEEEIGFLLKVNVAKIVGRAGQVWNPE